MAFNLGDGLTVMASMAYAAQVPARPLEVRTTQALWAILLLTMLPTLSAFVIQHLAQRRCPRWSTELAAIATPARPEPANSRNGPVAD